MTRRELLELATALGETNADADTFSAVTAWCAYHHKAIYNERTFAVAFHNAKGSERQRLMRKWQLAPDKHK